MSSIISYLKTKIATFIAMAVGVFATVTGALTFDLVQVVTGVVLLVTAYVVYSGDDEEKCCDEDH